METKGKKEEQAKLEFEVVVKHPGNYCFKIRRNVEKKVWKKCREKTQCSFLDVCQLSNLINFN